MNWRLMYDKLVLGEIRQSDTDPELTIFVPDKGVQNEWLPMEFRGYVEMCRSDGKEYSVAPFLNVYITERTVPANRIGIRGILKRLGMKQYDVHAVFEKLHGAVIEGYWFAFTESDSYEKCSLRGQLGKAPDMLGIQNIDEFRWM